MTWRSAVLWAVLAIAAGALWALSNAWRTDELATAPPPPAPTDAAVAVLPAPVDSAPSASAPTPVSFQDGFCSAAGVESFTVRYSLERLLITELRRRLDGGALSADTRALLDAANAVKRPDALELARQAVARAPDSPFPLVAVALAAAAAGQGDEQLGALRRARQLLPSDPALGLAVAEATRDSPDLDEAIEGLSVYLATDASPPVSRLRARLEVQRDIQRSYRRLTRDGVTVLWPAESLTERQADELAVAVDRGLDDAAAFSGTQRRARLTVVVYPSRSELLAVSCARAWAGGLYDGTLRVVAAATAEGGVDWKALRHETLHAQLSPLAPAAPRWFHEGAAQSFAQQTQPRQKWALMVKNRVWVPFTSLDGSFQIFGADSDADLAYAQSLAMVELMRDLGGDRSIFVALTAFQAGADTPTALARACNRAEVTGEDLLGFLERRLSAPR